MFSSRNKDANVIHLNPFFKLKPNLILSDISKACGLFSLHLKKQSVTGFAPLSSAGSSELSFFHNPKYRDALKNTKALACFVTQEYAELLPDTTIPLITETPYRALAQALQYAYVPVYERFDGTWTDQGFFLGKDAHIGADVKIGPYSVIGPGVHIGDGTHIGAHVTIENALIGTHCQILSGAVIGDESLSFDRDSAGKIDVPQFGCVRIGDHVCIGSQTIVDRGSLQDTTIGDHTAIGGLVHVGHNVQIGKGVTIISQTGIAGSTVIDDLVIVGGQAGIAGHLHIGKGAQIAGQSGVTHEIPAYTKVMGSPAVEANTFKRQMYNLQKLGKGRLDA